MLLQIKTARAQEQLLRGKHKGSGFAEQGHDNQRCGLLREGDRGNYHV